MHKHRRSWSQHTQHAKRTLTAKRALLAAALAAVFTPAQAELLNLGDLAGGIFFSEAFGVSADGTVVVGRGNSASGIEAFRWTQAGGMVGLGDLPGGGFSSDARGVSADGTVVVGRGSSASGNEAFRWTQAGGMVGLGDLAGGSFDSPALGVSTDGTGWWGEVLAPAAMKLTAGHKQAAWWAWEIWQVVVLTALPMAYLLMAMWWWGKV